MSGDAATGLELMQAYLRGERPAGGMVRLLGLRPVAVERGSVSFEADPTEAHANSGGTIHGGYVTTLLDTAMGCAALTVLDAGKGVTTLELKVTFQRATTPRTGRVLAVGTVTSHGRRVVFTEARLTDAAGRALASASSTLLVLER